MDPVVTSSSLRVGLFWFVAGRRPHLISHVCGTPELYGDNLTCPHGHYALWESIRAGKWRPLNWRKSIGYEYEDWPRGRIVLDPKAVQATIYCDHKIIRPDLLAGIRAKFALPLDSQVKTDKHYANSMSLR